MDKERQTLLDEANFLLSRKKKLNVLDLFCGTGSFGLECLSRKARHVIFVENYKGILPILKKNLSNLKTINNYSIIEKNILIESENNEYFPHIYYLILS